MKIVTIKLDNEVYEELLKKAKEEGFLTVAEYVNSIVLRTVEKSEKGGAKEAIEEQRKPLTLDRLISIVERKVLDSINPFTQKIDDVNRRIASVIEKLEILEERINNLEERVKGLEKVPEEAVVAKEAKKAKKTAIEILKEQKVIFERDIVSKIRDRDTFFAKLEREGAIVVEGKDERIAVDPQFWHQLLDKLKNIKTNNDEELKRVLDPVEYKIVQKLRESALLVFDSSSRTWNLVL